MSAPDDGFCFPLFLILLFDAAEGACSLLRVPEVATRGGRW
jgi:hypothetical protein